MKVTDDLFLLIQSLTKSEKGYYKKFALRHSPELDSNYLKLFKEIEKQTDTGDYNENLIKNKFKNFAFMKLYLFETILRSLSSFYSHATKNNELKESLKYIDILYRKALYKKCLKLLEKTKLEALKYDNLYVLLEIFRWEKNFIREGHIKGSSAENLQQISQEEVKCLNNLKNLGEFASIGCKANNIVKTLKGTEMREGILKLFSHPLLKTSAVNYTYQEKINYYHLKSVLSTYLNKPQAAYFHQKKLISEMENSPDKIKENRLNYIIGMYNLLLLTLTLKKYKEFSSKLKKLRNLPVNTPESFAENLKIQVFVFTSLLELKFLTESKNFNDGLNAVTEINSELKRYKRKISRKDELEICSYISILYFSAGLFDAALKWNNKITNENSKGPATDIMISSRIYDLFIHYELNNLELLDYLIKSAIRFLKSSRKSDEVINEALSFLKKISRINSKKKLLLQYQYSKDKFKKLKKRYPNSHLLNQFDIISYIENKINT